MLIADFSLLSRLAASVGRKALKDVTLSDGTVLPAGTLVVANSFATHRDDAHYPNAGEFDPFRFARIREGDGEGTKHQFVATSTSYVPFGVGRHAWYVKSLFPFSIVARCGLVPPMSCCAPG